MEKQVSITNLFIVMLCVHYVPVKSISYQLHNYTQDWLAKFKEYAHNDATIKFMPGIYEIQDDILITNVSNLSISGVISSLSHVALNCSNQSSWIITNSSYIEVTNIKFLNCGNYFDTQLVEDAALSELKATVFIYNVTSIKMVNVTMENSCGYGIITFNITGMCTFEHITIHGNDTLSTTCTMGTLLGGIIVVAKDNEAIQEHTVINITQCLFYNIQTIWDSEIIYSIKYFISSIISLFLHQVTNHVDVNIENVNMSKVSSPKRSIIFISYSMNGTSNVTIANSSVDNTITSYSTFKITHTDNFEPATTEITNLKHKLYLTSCQFRYNKADKILTILNVSISMQLQNNIFANNIVEHTVFKARKNVPVISGYLNFSNNTASVVWSMKNYVLLNDGAMFSFSNNFRGQSKNNRDSNVVRKTKQSSPDCPFQFINGTNVNIIFHENTGYYRTVYGNSPFGCSWIKDFPNRDKLLPSEVYAKIIHHNGVDSRGISGWDSSVCLCNDTSDYCLKASTFSVYPGETFSIGFRRFYVDVALYTTFNEAEYNRIAPSCGIYPRFPSTPKTDLISNYCTKINYTVSTQHSMCLLLLKSANIQNNVYALRIKIKNCSLGFVLDHEDGVCKCHPKFSSNVNGLKCDISNQAFQSPPGGWIGSDSSGVIYTTDCHLGYCLQHPSWVKLAQPDSQCLPSRTGVACGECAPGLSTVFGSSRCKKCTSYWLFLLPVFALAGLLLVLALFVFDLTVVDGNIYGFILMVNSLSTHDTRVFHSTEDLSWTLVSLSNLDLGIEVCFYNGMTAYFATWLRLIFPVYVLLLVVAMAYASRYFQIIERIRRKRVIPVIATLYLLSYNKLMLVTFRGLFSYTSIYHLSTNEVHLYWSPDTSIPTFGVQFTLLFTFCLLVFLLVIVPTNILLISGKIAYRFKVVVMYLKPFLDAYQAPFKENCRHFLGVELILRSLMFASISFAPQNTAALYTALIIVYLVYLCQVTPFKSRFNSFLYCSYLLYMSAYIILFVRFYPFNENGETYRQIFNLVCYISFMQFLGIIGIHIYKYKLRYTALFSNCEKIIKKYKSRWRLRKRKVSNSSKQHVKTSAGRYENFQEELLALESD